MAAYEEVWSGRRQSAERQIRETSLSTAVTDRLTDNVRQEPAGRMFGDDASSCPQSRERWRKEGSNADMGEWLDIRMADV